MVTKTWIVTPFIPSDLNAIAHFFKINYQGSDAYGSMDLFQWKVIDNYIQEGIINIIKDNGKIVAITSVTPKMLYSDGEKILVGEIGDTYTDSSYQRQGMFTAVGNTSTQDALSKKMRLIYGTPNEQALPGWLKKANYSVINKLNVDALTLPLRPQPSILKGILWPIGIVSGYVLGMFLLLFFGIKKLQLINCKYTIEKNFGPTEGWDDLWESVSKKYSFILDRSRSAIVWRYVKNPNKYLFYNLKLGQIIVGYLILRIVNNNGIIRYVISDFLMRQGEEKKLSYLLLAVLRDALIDHAKSINTWCLWKNSYFKIFKQFGFLKRKKVPIIAYNNEFSTGLFLKCNKVHFTIGDSDNI